MVDEDTRTLVEEDVVVLGSIEDVPVAGSSALADGDDADGTDGGDADGTDTGDDDDDDWDDDEDEDDDDEA